MSDLQSIKERVYREEKIEYVLELLGCWGIKSEQRGYLYTAGLPDGDNSRSVQVKNNEYLSSYIRSKGIDGDIFSIVSYIIYECETKEDIRKNIHRSKYWLCNKLNYYEYIDDFYKLLRDEIEEVNYNKWLHDLQRNRVDSNCLSDNVTYDDSVLNEYINIPHIRWINDGINYHTQVKFQVGFDVRSERIIFPIHNKDGKIISVKGRYVGNNSLVEDEYKYIYMIPCNKSIEFFNYHRALPYINESKEVIVVEGAKTVMLLDQWGYKNVISIEGDSLSYCQMQLLKDLGLDVKLVFAWDKDKDVQFIKNQTSQINGRLKFAIFDKDNLLKGKDSPCDRGEDVFDVLYQNNKYRIGG